MLENFKNYLIQRGYKEYSEVGNHSTVYDYGQRIVRVCEKEGISINLLADHIGRYVEKYDNFGSEAEYGKKSSSSVINALKRFEEFSKIQKSDNNLTLKRNIHFMEDIFKLWLSLNKETKAKKEDLAEILKRYESAKNKIKNQISSDHYISYKTIEKEFDDASKEYDELTQKFYYYAEKIIEFFKEFPDTSVLVDTGEAHEIEVYMKAGQIQSSPSF